MMRSAQLECSPWCSPIRKKSGCATPSTNCTREMSKKNLDSDPHPFLKQGARKEREGIGAFKAEALAETPLEVLSRPPPETSARTG